MTQTNSRRQKGPYVKEQLEARLEELRTEFEAGKKMVADLDAQRANLQETLLRISGAIQVLEEELRRAQGVESRHKPDRDIEPAGDLQLGVTDIAESI